MPTIDLCNAPYDRPEELGGERLLCQYLKDHPKDRHSHFTAKVVDDAEMESRRIAEAASQHVPEEDKDTTPPGIADVVDGLNNGDYDPYLELLLSTAHSRKRALRGVRGFPRMDQS